MEGVAWLVRAGFDAEFVLDLPMDAFGEVLLVVQRQQLQQQMALGVTIMSAAAALFSKEGATKTMEHLQAQIDDIDDILRTRDTPGRHDVISGVTDEQEHTINEAGKLRKTTRKDPTKVIEKFHNAFRAFQLRTGGAVPPPLAEINQRLAAAAPQGQEAPSTPQPLPVVKSQSKTKEARGRDMRKVVEKFHNTFRVFQARTGGAVPPPMAEINKRLQDAAPKPE